MPNFLLQVSYTADALKKLIAKPQDRGEAVRKMIEKLGGSVTGTWLSVQAIKTTPLLSMEEGLAALKKAGNSPYKATGQR